MLKRWRGEVPRQPLQLEYALSVILAGIRTRSRRSVRLLVRVSILSGIPTAFFFASRMEFISTEWIKNDKGSIGNLPRG